MTVTPLELLPRVADPRARRYSTTTVRVVRQMYDGGQGWGKSEIQRYLAARGIPVSYSTLGRWLDDRVAERDREDNRRRSARRRRERRDLSDTPLLDRMRALKAAGASHRSIAAVLRVDEGIEIDGERVRYCLRVGAEPERPQPTGTVAA